MSKTPKKKSRILKRIAVVIGALIAFLLLFVGAFVFNPFEGTVRDVRDLVPRGVNFFARKQHLADDFVVFPEPKLWEDLSQASGFAELDAGPIGQELRQAGLERAVQQARQAAEQVGRDSGGWVDLLGDLIGREVLVAGYVQDYQQQTPRPLAEPWWCCYLRVSWRIKAALGLAGFGYVQDQVAQNGVRIETKGDMLVVTPAGAATLYIKRHLDVLMVANSEFILEQSQRLIDGNRDEEPFGRVAAYADGAVARIEEWADDNAIDEPNVVEYMFEPNAFDAFLRFASVWPNPAAEDSMNERVLASFLNLKGWLKVTGGLMFDGTPGEEALCATGQIALNSKQHSAFQSSFYTAESRPRGEWLEPFIGMVPDSACAAAALRMPVGEFMHAMFGALEPAERDLMNEMARRSTFQNAQLTDMNDLIQRLQIALLPRAGFVFRRNVEDLSRDDDGNLMVPVARKSPMPQVAWVFWIRPGSNGILDDLISMVMNNSGSFHINKVWHFKVPFPGGTLPEPVTEFCNPQIPATGEVAMMVFRQFFMVSNSGALIKDIMRTHYRVPGNKSIQALPQFALLDRELPDALNGFLWLRGKNLLPVLDDYLRFAEADNELPDPGWLSIVRLQVEEEVRRARFARYRSKASMPREVREGEFEEAVQQAMRDKWRREKTSFSAKDRGQMSQLRAMAQLLDVGYVQLELTKNFIRFQTKLLLNN
ncbi:MAG: hypothetical protein KDC98_15015 [Planctomycetes bacterium]|nr:hypothetical protein [Planctomycetota bacterium]